MPRSILRRPNQKQLQRTRHVQRRHPCAEPGRPYAAEGFQAKERAEGPDRAGGAGSTRSAATPGPGRKLWIFLACTTGLENCRQAQRSPRAVRGGEPAPEAVVVSRGRAPIDVLCRLGGEADTFTVRRASDVAGTRRLRPHRSRPAPPGTGRPLTTPTPGTGGHRRATGRTQRPVSTTPPRRPRGTAYRRAPAPTHGRGEGRSPRPARRSPRARASTAPPRARCTDPVDDHPRVGS